ncbi:MAG: hypothetical protein PHR87_09080 [Sulfurospirillaceae bacterium]|nr:hypothetical protein [Sulfurospirillaceae bacterium]
MIRLFLSFLLCLSTLSADYFRDALLAYKQGNFTVAKELFELSIKKQNSFQGYFFLGKMYLHGEGVDANSTLAIPYLEQAVMKGNIKAKCYLAEAYLKNDVKQAEAILLLSQGAKETPICREIATTYNLYINGQ